MANLFEAASRAAGWMLRVGRRALRLQEKREAAAPESLQPSLETVLNDLGGFSVCTTFLDKIYITNYIVIAYF